MWFSSGGTKSVLHNDHAENIMCVFKGTKEFFLIDREYQEQVKFFFVKFALGLSIIFWFVAAIPHDLGEILFQNTFGRQGGILHVHGQFAELQGHREVRV